MSKLSDDILEGMDPDTTPPKPKRKRLRDNPVNGDSVSWFCPMTNTGVETRKHNKA